MLAFRIASIPNLDALSITPASEIVTLFVKYESYLQAAIVYYIISIIMSGVKISRYY